MKSWFLAAGVVFVSISISLGCSGGDGDDEGGDVGAPCEVEEDCASGLICDDHNGQGSCQEEHDH